MTTLVIMSIKTKIPLLFKITLFLLWMTWPADGEVASGWQPALPGWQYRFPDDHSVHPDYKTEWWYFTGNLQDDRGHNYGYELTFFRQGVLPPAERTRLLADSPAPNRFVQSDFKFAHFAVSDLNAAKFHFTQKINRGAFGESGFGAISSVAGAEQAAAPREALAWMEDWSLRPQSDGSWRVTAKMGGEDPMSIDLRLLPQKGPVIEGTDGVSQKAAGLGNASHYYSFTRLRSTGTLSLGKDTPANPVHGDSWFDHEWASNQLAADQVGWDWFCCQFNDGTELMLYAMRRQDGTVDPVSSGTWIEADGRSEYLRREDFTLQPTRSWKSAQTGATYPVEWRVRLPGRQLDFTIKSRLDTQELVLPLVSYWEGATIVEGERAGQPVKGVGYMELTGYAAAMHVLQNAEGRTASQTVKTPR